MFNKSLKSPGRTGRSTAAALLLLGALATGGAQAASSAGCEGGGFTVLGRSGTQNTAVPAAQVTPTFEVVGKYVTFQVDAATFGIRNYTLTGAANALDITGGRSTPVFASKLPEHRGLTLTGDVFLEQKDDALSIGREGPGLVMKLQAKDCANGGVFQMEVERADETTTLFTHTLAGIDSLRDPLTAFYSDNRNFRNREGDVLPYKDTTVTVSPRINFGNDFSAKFVGRDSPQVATRVNNSACTNIIQRRAGASPSTATVLHCGGISKWLVASGGRMGMVFGEDATEVAPPATTCVQNCQAQNRVRGRAVVLGFPFPVAAADRLKPRNP
ncbi:hypothetical protein [Polaromonas sp.]|uniref:hypothetical protein n=1 Tax=Polaromonas sp. TaxID=1869339 RepID=UPI00286A762A|nr:hypothetical protein [Polaromonas sp.]